MKTAIINAIGKRPAPVQAGGAAEEKGNTDKPEDNAAGSKKKSVEKLNEINAALKKCRKGKKRRLGDLITDKSITKLPYKRRKNKSSMTQYIQRNRFQDFVIAGTYKAEIWSDHWKTKGNSIVEDRIIIELQDTKH